MARYTGAVCRQCRREGQKLMLKGERCYTEKCSFTKRSYAPGQHGNARTRKPSDYGMQLRAKQKARRYYGISESQFYHYYELAVARRGVTGTELLKICESRLDNTVYRLGLASSRAEARLLVVHGHFNVNGKRVDIPSYLLKDGDEISVREKSHQSAKFKQIQEVNGGRPVPTWLEGDSDKLTGKYVRQPEREEIDLEVEEQLIVEGYSK